MQCLTDLTFSACRSRVNIWDPAFCFTIRWHLAATRVGLPSYQILTLKLDSKSLNTSLLEVMICSNNEGVFICDLSDLNLQIIFDAWWGSMNVGSKCLIACDNSRLAPTWRFYLHCRIEETGSPGIICIVSHQVLRHPSEHGTSSLGTHLLAKAHIAKLNEITESEVTELTSFIVDETALVILRRQGSQGITIVSLQVKFVLVVQVRSIETELTDIMLQTGSEGLWNFQILPRNLESLPHIRICFGSYSLECYIKSRATMVL